MARRRGARRGARAAGGPRWVARALAPWGLAAGLLAAAAASANQRADFRPEAPALAPRPALGDGHRGVPSGPFWRAAAPDAVALDARAPDEDARDPDEALAGLAALVFADEPALLPALAFDPSRPAGAAPPQAAPAFRRGPLEGATGAVAGGGGTLAGGLMGGTLMGSALAGRAPGAGGVTPTADGGTPGVPRAVALASSTPAASEPAVIAMPDVGTAGAAGPTREAGLTTDAGAARAGRPHAALSARAPDPPGAPPRYADLLRPETAERERRCLAEAVYFEARSEPEAGQAAVAQVVLNRARSGLYPASVCGVVYQNRHRYKACQFSFACEGKSLRVTDAASFATATRVARAVLDGTTYMSEVGASTHYHADYVRPGWSRRLKKMEVIGRHVFYTLKPGQT